jgi:23S rRNA U2552 (ribose-2'-O)-methylase RlmE/FtsJ
MTRHVLDPPWKRARFINLHQFNLWKLVQIRLMSSQVFLPIQDQVVGQTETDAEVPFDTQLPSLSEMKDKIAAFHDCDEWERRKKITNPYEYIFSMSDSELPAVRSLKKEHAPLSRSYFKMVEILKLTDFWSSFPNGKPIQTAHICEGPGGFIQAAIEGGKESGRSVGRSIAMTLRPNRPNIPGWRRSIQYLRTHPEILLEYGEDSTGDILQPANQKAFLQRVNCSAALFTADGGFDFSMDYSKQEVNAFPLILASFLIGLQSLQRGGMMVIKVFDIFTKATQDLLLGSSLCFKEFTIYKPATSRPCNSERYFIGKGFMGVPGEWISVLTTTLSFLKRSGSSGTVHSLLSTPFPGEIRRLFQEQIEDQIYLQVDAIEKCLSYTDEKKEVYIREGFQTSEEWCKEFVGSA